MELAQRWPAATFEKLQTGIDASEYQPYIDAGGDESAEPSDRPMTHAEAIRGGEQRRPHMRLAVKFGHTVTPQGDSHAPDAGVTKPSLVARWSAKSIQLRVDGGHADHTMVPASMAA